GSQTPVSNFALEIGKAAAVVRPEEDDGVIHFTRLFQLAQAFAYPVIHFRDIRIESRNIPAYTVRVGVEGRHLHLVGANAQRSVVSRPDLRFVRDRAVEDGKKRLPFCAVLVMSLVAVLI